MGSNLPLIIVITILAVTAVAVLIAVFVRERRTFAGYEELRPEILLLKSRLDAEVFRDGEDLVVSGTEKSIPVVVRFSYAENTPGMNIRMHAPSTMNFAVIPKNSQFYFPENLRANVNSPDDQFNARFLTRASDSAAARMFFMGRSITKELTKALCSSRTTLNITHGSLELTETTIPEPNAGRHAIGHIDSLMIMSAVLAQMPGAQLSQVEKPKLPKRLLTKSAIAMGAAAALLSIVGAARQATEPPPPPTPADQLAISERGAGVKPGDAPLISELENFRVVKPSEFDPGIATWMHGRGIDPDGRVPLTLRPSTTPDSQDVAYLLTTPGGKRRLVIISSGRVIFDARNYGSISIVRVPGSKIPERKPEVGIAAKPEGDGLLVVQDEDPDKSYMLFMSGNAMVNRLEPNWAELELR
jgi:hypothetical protein